MIPITPTPSIERIWGEGNPDYEGTLSIVVIGASGNLALRKTYPALLSLYTHNLLPPFTTIIGYARTEMNNATFLEKLRSILLGSQEQIDNFLSLCSYQSGQYYSNQDFSKLHNTLNELESKKCVYYYNPDTHSTCRKNRLYYYAIPPSQFLVVSRAIHQTCKTNDGFSRIVVEKPFGRDYSTCKELNECLSDLFSEEFIYRIDHYLGKEMIQNLIVTRFSNTIFTAVWNQRYIDNVQIIFKEAKGVDGRGGYFDNYGIIRDIMQNHLLQIVSLVSMEQPLTLHSDDIRDEKVRVLKAIEPLKSENTIIGQYVANEVLPGYIDDPTVPNDSKTATFAATVLHINTPRWAGVPFFLKCGKGLNESKTEIRIQFKDVHCPMFKQGSRNELVMRVQPDTAIYLKTNLKSPGIETKPISSFLDMTYRKTYHFDLPEAYERLILDVIRGDHSHFVRADELEISWKIFTPLLQQIEDDLITLIPYVRGTRGPSEADQLLIEYGFVHDETSVWTEYGYGTSP